MASTTESTPLPGGSAAQVALYQAALGPVHAEHYMPTFARFDERGTNGPAWNTAAAVGNLGWLIYRQLWGAAGEFAVALGVWALIAFGLAFWVEVLPLGVRAGLALALLLLLLAVPGLYGTALLHAQVRRRMIGAVKQAATIDEACTLLRWQGDAERRRGAWGVSGLFLAGAVLGWGLWFWSNASAPVSVVSGVVGEVALNAPVDASAEPLPAAPPPPAETLETQAAEAGEPMLAETPGAVAAPSVAEMASDPSQTGAAPAVPTHGGPASESELFAVPAEVTVRVKGHGVSVGLFAVAANAERAQAKLEDAGLPVLIDPIESSRGPMTRVRVGPFDSPAKAQAAAVRVRALGLDARVYAP